MRARPIFTRHEAHRFVPTLVMIIANQPVRNTASTDQGLAKPVSRFTVALLAVLLLTHAWALVVFGATFWIDSSVFAAFGSALGSAEEFRALYDLTGTFQYSHIGIGLPALWAALAWLPVNLQWPALALIQHALAIAATAAIFLTAHRLWPSWWHLVGAALVSLHPFYQAMHNALLTESIASSLLLFGIALTLRLLFLQPCSEMNRGEHGARRDERENRLPLSAPSALNLHRDFWLLLLCLVLIIQVRSYAGAMLVAMGAIAFIQRRHELRWTLPIWLIAVFFAGNAFLPAARWAVTGRLFTPSLGTNALLYATWMNPAPSPQLTDRILALGWLPESSTFAMFAPGFDYTKVRGIAAAWLAEGRSENDVRTRLGTLARLIEADRPGLLAMKARCGLASSGWVALGFAGSSPIVAYHGRTLAENRAHQLAHVRWLSWIAHPSYRSFGEGFFLHQRTGLIHDAEAQRDLWSALRKHISTRPPWLRDPLRLASLLPDVWATLGLVAIGLCAWRRPVLGLVLALPLAVNFAVTALSSLAGPRYAHPLLPVSLLAATLALALLTRRSAPPAVA